MYWITDHRSKSEGGGKEKQLLNVVKQMSKPNELLLMQAGPGDQSASGQQRSEI